MSIYRKVLAVERVFGGLEKDVAGFRTATGMQCKSECGLCCKKPDISATPLEFLPLAYHLYRQGQAYVWLDDLGDKDIPYCRVFQPFIQSGDKGFCSHYNYRGLICRLFGFAAMTDKEGQAQLVTCKTIKSEFSEAYDRVLRHIKTQQPVPIISNYYFQLRAIDQELGLQFLPVNKAITEALKVVLSYYAYRQKRGA